jgi:Skp family chaperone for outer membrane proteins
MKSLILLLLSISSFVFTINAAKVVTVDVQKVLSEYVAFNQAMDKVRSSVAPIEEEIQRMQEEITSIIADAREADATSNNLALDEEARDEARSKVVQLQSKLQSKQAQLQQFSIQVQELAQKGQEAELTPLQDKALATVEKIAKDEDIDVVIATANVIYSKESLDISDKVISELNK